MQTAPAWITLSVTALLVLLGVVPAVHAAAIFDSSASIDLDVSSTEGDFTVGNFATSFPTSTVDASGGGSSAGNAGSIDTDELSVAVSASGLTGVPPASSLAEISALLSFDIVNTESIPIDVVITFASAGALSGSVANLATEFATAAFGWTFVVGGTQQAAAQATGETSVFPLFFTSITQDFPLELEIPAGGTLAVLLTMFASGEGSALVTAVPSPATVVLLGIGMGGLAAIRLIGLGAVRRRRLR